LGVIHSATFNCALVAYGDILCVSPEAEVAPYRINLATCPATSQPRGASIKLKLNQAITDMALFLIKNSKQP